MFPISLNAIVTLVPVWVQSGSNATGPRQQHKHTVIVVCMWWQFLFVCFFGVPVDFSSCYWHCAVIHTRTSFGTAGCLETVASGHQVFFITSQITVFVFNIYTVCVRLFQSVSKWMSWGATDRRSHNYDLWQSNKCLLDQTEFHMMLSQDVKGDNKGDWWGAACAAARLSHTHTHSADHFKYHKTNDCLSYCLRKVQYYSACPLFPLLFYSTELI